MKKIQLVFKDPSNSRNTGIMEIKDWPTPEELENLKTIQRFQGRTEFEVLEYPDPRQTIEMGGLRDGINKIFKNRSD